MIALLVDGAIHAWEAGKNTVRRRSSRPPGLHLSYPQPHPQPRDRAALGKAGLRAGEIANLTWDMVVGPNGEISTAIELRDRAAKKRSGRLIPLHKDLR